MDFSGSAGNKKSMSFSIFADPTSKTSTGETATGRSTGGETSGQNSETHALKHSRSAMPLGPSKASAPNRIPLRGGPQAAASTETAVDQLLAKLQQHHANNTRKKGMRSDTEDGTSSTATESCENILPTAGMANDEGRPDAAELFRLKKELADAQERMAQMNIELTQSRITRHTVEEAIGSPFPAAQHLAFNMAGPAAQPATGGIAGKATSFPHPQSTGTGPGIPWRLDTRGTGFDDMFGPNHIDQPSANVRPSSAFENRFGYQSGSTPPRTPLNFQAPFALPNGMNNVQQAPIGTRLSPTAAEFATMNGGAMGWNAAAVAQNQAVYAGSVEPLNYRRLLDRNVNCNWKYIVDKIVGSNDQQASIFLQQKLKMGTVDQKFEIVQAIIDQAYPLMINRFGNFLVQRCFEHGTPEQIVSIAQAIRGNTLNLSMDAFGCHVVQKAFDCVPEEYKAIMVHELLRRIPETVIHRYACHVWQKLFELRWSGSPPQIMKFVNEALRGMWHEVALGETGSLVVQNIFENCLEEDKRPCINEVLAGIDVVAHGQFGNWCVQHICEHGSSPDRSRAIEHILRFATEYSTDQFASKVVEKCLKIGGSSFLDRYLERVCEPRPDCPRMPLIDIAGDQFGNYLVQYILTNADSQRRDVVATHIRKHMVSLRGSKYGSRVAMLCCNPAYAIRPGPPAGLPATRSNSGYGDRFGADGPRPYAGERQYVGMGRGGYGTTFR